MSDHVYKVIEVVGSSDQSSDAAVRRAIEVAGQTVKNIRWCEVAETRAQVENQKIAHWQVRVRIGFTVEQSM
jgi:flavin-binding protein dodecin